MMTEWMNKWLMAIFCWMIFMPVPDLLAQSAKTKDDPRITLRMKEVSLPEVLSEIERQAGVTFSYESSLLKELPKISFQVKDEALTDCLTRLFESYPIVYKVSGKIVILKRRQRQVTISGFVRDQASSESLIGASVYEVASRKGSATNSYGFFSLTLPPGNIRLHASYIGYESCSFNFTELDRDTILNIELRPNARLEEVVVTASERDRLSVNNTLMGTMEFSQKTIKATPTLFGESDIVKTLQLTPGVASGTEGLAGLYVRGGDQDGNLFLIDGNPVYQINHVGGLFSAFNPEAIRNLDFFKAGFPARYGGRLSSVVDVHTKEGNMKEYHGSATIGLISGNLSLEGPIIKDRTAFLPIPPKHLRVHLYAISAEYYRYLKVLQDKDTDSVSNLLIDGGLAEPIRVFSNIDGGVGILGSCHVGMFETEIASSSHSNLEAARFEDGID